jgi:hypothetical protein
MRFRREEGASNVRMLIALVVLAAPVFWVSCPAGVQCDLFDVFVRASGDSLTMQIDTDLPDDTRLIVTVSRCYWETDNDETYSHDYFSGIDERVGEWRISHTILVDDQRWSSGLQAKIDQCASLDIWAGLAAISDSVGVAVRVPEYKQSNPEFGELNRNLTGRAVRTWQTSQGKAANIDVETVLDWPFQGPTPRAVTRAPQSLRPGGTYRIDATREGVPLMPEFEPADAWTALPRVRTLSGFLVVRVTDARPRGAFPWYEVVVRSGQGDESISGWINSVALIGHRIEAVE